MLTIALLLMVFSIPHIAYSQTCVFETAADLYKVDDDEPQKIYRPKLDGTDIQYYESGSIDAAEVKIKAKKVLLIHDQYQGHFLLVHTNNPRCSEGSQLLARPENEEIIVLTKQGELIKGYGTIFPYSENLKIYKDEHHSGDYYRSVSSTTEVVFLIYFIDENPDTKFFVTGKELTKYANQLYDLLIPAFETPAVAFIETQTEPTEPQVEEIAEIENVIIPVEQSTNLPEEPEMINEVEEIVLIEEKTNIENSSEDEHEVQVAESSSLPTQFEEPPVESKTPPPLETLTEQNNEETENTEQLLTDNQQETDNKEPIETTIEDSSAPILSSESILKPKNKLVLSDLEKDELMIKAKEKVETLGGCFEIIASTSAANAFKDDNYKLAVSLFIHDSVEVAVSSLTRNTFKHYKITTYLKRMRTFNYTDVEISFHNVSKVSNLRLNPDGTYTGIITFSQVFRGFIEGKPVYADRTDKNIEIIIRAREVFAGSLVASVEWDVFLGNIGVDQTSAF